ncbi:TetR family transcriptional regulator C-terminal domain-containing protein [Nocardia sp. CDC159]|uniref:TetR family transcriptional regulator C-terminal domain-containing protein n=1 Tax=Nocardia pulmonis TaxID=2951408 RepID=A0A9X2EBP3_9NOCA|nr:MULTISPECIES: TetR family transcriptional regulator C-terminal domain-containing protein [Nocardia]MCM6775183.1 TetR family transcriptional regulator C-terminal domain-containing protein [Nocardia pulmonis]MCM6789653.1 TetR family transcriptional regulator C-terminal domain-containing protein [Nocardia sp. CDC159]
MGAKQADSAAQAERRRELLDRLAEVIAEDGMEGVSIRTLAARAGVSIGTVQYYFATKSELLQRVWEHVRDETADRFWGSGVADETPARQLEHLTELLVPPGSDDRLTRVWLALIARAAHDPQLAALHRAQWQRLEELIAHVLAAANPARADEAREAAAEFLALMDGFAIAVITEPDRMPPARATRIAQAWTTAWLGGRS